MAEAAVILTDSGGIQEEAPALGIPVLVMRESTERTEALGPMVKLVGTETERIIHETSLILDNSSNPQDFINHRSCYGDGHSAARIVNALKQKDLL